MRLAFAVAINVDADILLIDEILAVGDAAFQAKCFRKLQEIKGKGTTIVIVSHAMAQIENICDRSIWIEDGVIRMDGIPRDVHPVYMERMSKKNHHGQDEGDDKAEVEKDEDGKLKRWGSGEAKMTDVSVIDAEGKKRYEYSPWESFTVHIDYEAQKELKDVVIGLAIYRNDGAMVYGTNTLIDTAKPVELKEKGSIDLKVENLPVSNGMYVIDLALHKPDGFNYDFWRNICKLEIADKAQTPGEIALGHSWEVS